jgi:phosphate/sulfate permease
MGLGRCATRVPVSTTYIDSGSVSGVGDSEEVTINCPKGEKAVGVGVNFASNDQSAIAWDEPLVKGDNLTAASDGKNPVANGWRVRVVSTSASTSTFEVGGVCAKLVKVG